MGRRDFERFGHVVEAGRRSVVGQHFVEANRDAEQIVEHALMLRAVQPPQRDAPFCFPLGERCRAELRVQFRNSSAAGFRLRLLFIGRRHLAGGKFVVNPHLGRKGATIGEVELQFR